MSGKWHSRIRRSAAGSASSPRLGRALREALGVGADELDVCAGTLHDDRVVAEEYRLLLDPVELRGARERISRDRDIVVSEHDVRPFEAAEEPPEERHARGDARRGRL